jgi:cytochrome c oxidase assembly protein subunit 11
MTTQTLSSDDERRLKNRRLLVKLIFIILGMFAFSYALVPLYNVMCKALGVNGKTGGSTQYNYVKIDKDRTITIEFIASNNDYLPWAFHPNLKKLRFHPGELKRVSFFAENDSDHEMTVQAIPSVTPGIAAKYLKKTECFCFTQQTLKQHEKMDMPILFHIDPALPKYIHTITLSYTLFDVTGRHYNTSKKKGVIG